MTTFLVLWSVMLTGAIVLILLGAGQLMARMVRLEDELADVRTQIDSVGVRASSTAMIDWTRNESTFVLAVEPRCIACTERSHELSSLVDGLSDADVDHRRFVLLGPSGIDDHSDSARLETMSDTRRFGQLVVTATPTVITFDADGHEQSRTVVGSEQALQRALDAFVALAPSPSIPTGVATASTSGNHQGDRS